MRCQDGSLIARCGASERKTQRLEGTAALWPAPRARGCPAAALRGGLGERLHVAGEHTPRWHIHMAVGEESWFLVPTGPLECPHGVAAGPLEQVTEEGQAGGSRVPRGSE